MKKIAIFDLDFTIINMNSTYEFIKYFFYTTQYSYKKTFFIIMYFVLDAMGFPLQYFLNKRMWFISLLKNIPEHALKKAARNFIQDKVRPVMNNEVLSQLQTLKRDGHYCVILSSSLDFVVQAFANTFSFDDYIASAVAFDDNGVCLGYLVHDVTGIKEDSLVHLESKVGPIDYDQSYFFTDNQEDIGLAKRIRNSFGVISEAIRKKYWLENGMGVLPIIPALRINPHWFFMPGMYYYYFRTTIKNIIYYQIGFLVLVVALLKPEVTIVDFLLLLFSLAGYVAIYEMGYFLNDYKAVKEEKHPSLRISTSTCEKLKIGFFSTSILFFVTILFLLSFSLPSKFIGYYLIANIVTLVVFVLHNFLKQESRLLTYSVLKLSHFIVPVLVFGIDITIPLLTMIIVYLPIALMRYYKKGYNMTLRRLMFFARIYACLIAIYFSALCIVYYFGYIPTSFYFIFFFYMMFANIVYYQDYLVKMGLRSIRSLS